MANYTKWDFTAACVERLISPHVVEQTLVDNGYDCYPETLELLTVFLDENF